MNGRGGPAQRDGGETTEKPNLAEHQNSRTARDLSLSWKGNAKIIAARDACISIVSYLIECHLAKPDSLGFLRISTVPLGAENIRRKQELVHLPTLAGLHVPHFLVCRDPILTFGSTISVDICTHHASAHPQLLTIVGR